MAESKAKVQNQVKEVSDQINNNAEQAFSLLTNYNDQIGKMFTMSLEMVESMTKNTQKIGKEFVDSSMNVVNEAVKVAKSCNEGALNLTKK